MNPEDLWPGLVKREGAVYVVNQAWAVVPTGGVWEPWPWPECTDGLFDFGDYRAAFLDGRDRARGSAVDAIRLLLGDPRG